jgi:hypothetical protein
MPKPRRRQHAPQREVLRKRDGTNSEDGDTSTKEGNSNKKTKKYDEEELLGSMQLSKENQTSNNNKGKKQNISVKIFNSTANGNSNNTSSITSPPADIQALELRADNMRIETSVSSISQSTRQTTATENLSQQEAYIKWRNEQGNTTTLEEEKRSVQRYVKETLFSRLKFIRKDQELDYDGKQ